MSKGKYVMGARAVQDIGWPVPRHGVVWRSEEVLCISVEECALMISSLYSSSAVIPGWWYSRVDGRSLVAISMA